MHEIKKVTPPNMCKNFRDSKEKFRFVFKHSISTHQLRENCTYGEKKVKDTCFFERICYKTTTTVNT